ncbi:MAG: YbhB/YbcL family Raf kinase inhibitor-like protein [Steroidobacteraceae bacterium]
MCSKRRITGLCLAAAALAAALAPAMAGAAGAPAGAAPATNRAQRAFTLHSPDIAPGGTIGSSYVYDHSGCTGDNVSPAFSWSHPPAGTRSFALLVFDSDVPEGGFWHWVVFNIPATVRSLRAGAGDPTKNLLPRDATQTRNDFGFLGYGGPCPPSGSRHHYHFMLYALKVAKLGLDASAMPEQVDSRVTVEALGEAEIVAVFAQ